MRILLAFLIILIWICSPAGATVASERIAIADSLSKRQKHTEAYNIYQSVAMSYRSSMSKAEKMECLEALYGSINEAIAMSKYRETMRNLILAEDLRDYEKISDDRLAIFYSCLYISIGQDVNNKKMLAKCFPDAEKAFAYGLKTRDAEMMQRSFTHLLACYYHTQDRKLLPKIDSVYRIFDREVPDRKMGHAIGRYYRAMLSEFRDHDYKAAAAQYDSIDKELEHDPRYSDLWSKMMMYSTESRCKAGEWEEAEKGLQRTLERADSLQLPIFKQGIYTYYSYYYRLKGDTVTARQYEEKKRRLTDSISSVGVIDEFFSIEKIKGERDLHRQVDAARYRSRVILWIAIAVGLIAIGGLIFGYILRRKNKTLMERARLLRQLLKERGEERIPHPGDSAPAAEEPMPTDDQTQRKEKYGGSNLSEMEKKEIASGIKKVLDTDIVFSTDFTLGMLAEKVGKSSKAVSQVINETFGYNFSTVVNRIRIYEACRRMDSPEYDLWSVEGIAESVGYAQRNTFSTNFKKFTGMTLKEYKKLSKEDRENIRSKDSEE